MPKRPSSSLLAPSIQRDLTPDAVASSSSGAVVSDGRKPEATVGAHEPRPAAKPRRSFTVEQKHAILSEAARCTQPGDVGALLRKHGIYSSTLSKWRKALSSGALRGPGRPAKLDDKDKEIAELRRRLDQLDARARRAERLVDFQKKTLSLLEAARALGENS